MKKRIRSEIKNRRHTLSQDKEFIYKEEECIHFKEGIIGFEEQKKYIPLPIQGESDAILCLQCVDDLSLSFVIMNPFFLDETYSPKISKKDMDAIGAKEESVISYYVICVVKDIPANSTVNLKCPIIVNSLTREAKQVILEEGEYRFRHPLSEFSRKEK